MTDYSKILTLDSLKYLDENEVEQTEEWRPVKGYVGFYEVSSLGRIKSLKRIDRQNKLVTEKIMRLQKCTNGYLFSIFSDNIGKRQMLTHRVVAIAFLENTEQLKTVNHKKGVKTDNRVSQLEWASYSENNLHSYRVLGTIPAVRGKFGAASARAKKVLCTTTGEVFDSRNIAAEKYGLIGSNISMVCSGKYTHSGGYKFKYL